MESLQNAQILLVGVSRTSKTPTSMYLANRGYWIANYALVPGVPFPLQIVEKFPKLFIVGLTTDPKGWLMSGETAWPTSPINPIRIMRYGKISEELSAARRLFSQQGWPVLDVSRRSVEETAAAILHLYMNHKEATAHERASQE